MLFPRERLVRIPGGCAIFDCLALGSNNITLDWVINGSLLDELSFPNAIYMVDESNFGMHSTLNVKNLSMEQNCDLISCEVRNGQSSQRTKLFILGQSNNVMLLVVT